MNRWSGPDIVAVVGGTLLAVLTVLLWLGSSAPLVFVEARATYVRYEIQREDVSLLALREAIVQRANGLCDSILDNKGLFTGLVRSPVGTTVEYTWHKNFAQISLTPGRSEKFDAEPGPTIVDREGQPPCTLETERVVFLISHEGMSRILPLPILGKGEIGVELGVPNRPEPGDLDLTLASGIELEQAPGHLILEGTARVMGRTSLWWDDGKLFPIADSDFIIPRGSRLVSSEENSPLVGNLVLARNSSAFDIEVSTEAHELKLFRFGQNQQTESFAVGAIARAFGDPSLAPILFLLGLVAIMLPIYFGFEAMIRERGDRK